MDAHWQVQEAKQRFSEVVHKAQTEGAQYVTKHGTEVAVVVGIEEYRRLTAHKLNFMEYLMTMPKGDDLDIERHKDFTRESDLFG